MIVAAILLPAAAVFIWAVFFRGKGRRHRRRRRQYRANPTLASTGGLPPVRKAEETPDQPES